MLEIFREKNVIYQINQFQTKRAKTIEFDSAKKKKKKKKTKIVSGMVEFK